MPKNPYFESAIHHFLLAAQRIAQAHQIFAPLAYTKWRQCILSFTFVSKPNNTIEVSWTSPKKGKGIFNIDGVSYYTRGDTKTAVNKQSNTLHSGADPVKKANDRFFLRTAVQIGKLAGLPPPTGKVKRLLSSDALMIRYSDEEQLSDTWASAIDVSTIDVLKMNTSVTSPEMRYITKVVGDLRGKKILDVGCGLGEASVYFALLGAKVTAVDISGEMLTVVKRLARANNVSVRAVQSAIEDLALPKGETFDYVYVGNVFHHVHITEALDQIMPHLKPEGLLVCWEPVDYNPIINVYRKMARHVRSPFERPFRLSDIDIFRQYFGYVSVRWFWLTTLVIFVIMYMTGRDPNKERYWKSVVREGEKWKPIYTPLERIDRILLGLFPFLGPMCWNVALVCRKPINITSFAFGKHPAVLCG